MLIQILEKPVQLQCKQASKQAKQARRTKLYEFAWQLVCNSSNKNIYW